MSYLYGIRYKHPENALILSLRQVRNIFSSESYLCTNAIPLGTLRRRLRPDLLARTGQ